MKRDHQMSIAIVAVTGIVWLCLPRMNAAQEPKPTDAPPAISTEDTGKSVTPKTLRDDQLAVSGRYARFERMLTQMADILGRQDPERADLLRRAIGKGREGRISEQIKDVVALIESGELGNASEKQAEIIASLQAMLKLLQSEDRRSAVERERDRLNDLLKDVRNVLAEQRSARAATQNAPAPSNAAPGQKKAISETEKLLEAMREHDEKDAAKDKEGNDNDSKDGSKDGKKSEPKDGDPKNSPQDPKEGEPKEGNSKQGDSKQPGKESEAEPDPHGTHRRRGAGRQRPPHGRQASADDLDN